MRQEETTKRIYQITNHDICMYTYYTYPPFNVKISFNLNLLDEELRWFYFTSFFPGTYSQDVDGRYSRRSNMI